MSRRRRRTVPPRGADIFAPAEVPAALRQGLRLWRGEPVDAVVCMRCDDDHPLILLDNRIGECRDCRARVQFRPTAPSGPPRLCVECACAGLP